MADPNALTDKDQAWSDFWAAREISSNPATQGRDHPSDARERERQAAVVGQHERASQLRSLINDYAPDPTFHVTNGSDLRRLREAAGFSVSEVTQALGISAQDLQSREASDAPAYCEGAIQRYAGAVASGLVDAASSQRGGERESDDA